MISVELQVVCDHLTAEMAATETVAQLQAISARIKTDVPEDSPIMPTLRAAYRASMQRLVEQHL